MRVLVCVLAAVALAQANVIKGLPSHLSGNVRITGGEEAAPQQFPWQVAIVANKGLDQSFCGGSLIARNYVLTAAQCVYGMDSAEMILGAHKFPELEGPQVRAISKIFIIHEDWNPMLIKNDIALIKLVKPVPLSDAIKLINLPTNDEATNSFAGETGTVSGWGFDSDDSTSLSPVLRFIESEILTNEECRNTYPVNVLKTNVCASGADGKSACAGDAGGALTVTKNGVPEQIGIASFGHNYGCTHNYPHVYTRVTSYLDWIAKNIQL